MEDAANRIVGHYERHALSWDADRRAAGWIDKPCIERFLSFLPRGATVLDLGCGGGSPVALHMVAHQALLTDFGFELIEHSINDPAKGGRIFWLARSR